MVKGGGCLFVVLLLLSAPVRGGEGLEALAGVLAVSEDTGVQEDVLAGILEGLAGRRRMTAPASWPDAYARLRESESGVVRERAMRVALIFEDAVAMRMLREEATDAGVAPAVRVRAIEALVERKAEGVGAMLLELAGDEVTRGAALRGLAEFDDPRTVEVILEGYESFDAAARRDAVQTLASRAEWATALLDAVEAGKVERSDLSAYTARQLQNLGDDEVSARVVELWGAVRATAGGKAKRIAGYRKKLSAEVLATADREEGRVLFEGLCASCHRLYGKGGAIGPDLTGAQRTNVDYLLENIVDPSASVAKDYQMEVIETTGGRVITGFVSGETEGAVTVAVINEAIIVPKDEIEVRTASKMSLMPEGMLEALTMEQVRELVAYLVRG
jgi:putative heme-binding domain-containing protein